MQHSMTISYEFVLYASGNVSEKTVNGFAKIHYDKAPSPLTSSNGTRSILGPGGLIATADDVVSDLSTGNLAGAAFKAFRGFNNASATDLKQAVLSELGQLTMDTFRGENPINRISVPNLNDLGDRAQTVVNTALSGGYADIISSNASKIATTAGSVVAGVALTKLSSPIAGVAAAAILGKVITRTAAEKPSTASQTTTPPVSDLPKFISATTTNPDGTTDTKLF